MVMTVFSHARGVRPQGEEKAAATRFKKEVAASKQPPQARETRREIPHIRRPTLSQERERNDDEGVGDARRGVRSRKGAAVLRSCRSDEGFMGRGGRLRRGRRCCRPF